MYCNNCGIKLKEGAKFCNECGTKVITETTTNNTNNVDSTSTINTNSMTINKNKAIASLVIGILSFVLGVVFLPIPLIGLILGINQKEKCGEKTTGIILNAIALGLSVITWIFISIFIAIGVAAGDTDYENDNRYYNSDEIIEDDYNDFDNYIDIFD